MSEEIQVRVQKAIFSLSFSKAITKHCGAINTSYLRCCVVTNKMSMFSICVCACHRQASKRLPMTVPQLHILQ